VVLGEMLTQLGVLNLVLALFNLLPGLPLDGGLVVKALVWQVTGSRRRGLVVANGCGRFLSFLALGLGSVLLLRGGGATSPSFNHNVQRLFQRGLDPGSHIDC
jgi:Zn-dependent protease